MKISLVTVSYNSASTIRDTFESILNQTYKDIEYIVIDGASTDGTLDIIKAFEPKFNGRMKWISEPDAGIYDAMNKGIRMATGNIIGIINSDDFYTNQFVIANIVNHFHKYDCEAVYGDLLYVDKENVNQICRYWRAGKYKPNSFKWGWMPPHPAFFCKKTVYEKHGLFVTDFKSAADYEFLLRVIHKGKIQVVYFPRIIVKMRLRGTSNISLKNRLTGNKEDRRAWKINNITPFFFTFLLKPVRKIPQYFTHYYLG
jgi:glycosyltransferase involved in cell wall biosynthesis